MLLDNQPQHQQHKSKKHFSSTRGSGSAGRVLVGVHSWVCTLGHSADLWIFSGLYYTFGVGCCQMVRMVLAGTPRATTLFCVSLLQQVSLGMFLWQSQGTKRASRYMQGLIKPLLRSCLLISHWPKQVAWLSPKLGDSLTQVIGQRVKI